MSDGIVTICLPAYGAGPYLAPAIESVLAQTSSRWRLAIGVEKTDDVADALTVCRSFSSRDDRIRVHVNDGVLGYAANVASLLDRVDTEMFAILPHDDLLHPEYVERLTAELARRPDAVLAYPDILHLGEHPGCRSLPLDDDHLATRLVSFHLARAEALPWRGVARASVLAPPNGARFSDNDYQGFAAECEWVQSLILRGPCVRVPCTLSVKRIPASDVATASRAWTHGFTAEERRAATDYHRRAMLDALDDAPLEENDRVDVVACCEAAMMLRRLRLGLGKEPLGDDDLRRLDRLEADAENTSDSVRPRLQSRLARILAHHHLAGGNVELALIEARRAVSLDPHDYEALVLLSNILLRSGKPGEALVRITDAAALGPVTPDVLRLWRRIATRLDRDGHRQLRQIKRAARSSESAS